MSLIEMLLHLLLYVVSACRWFVLSAFIFLKVSACIILLNNEIVSCFHGQTSSVLSSISQCVALNALLCEIHQVKALGFRNAAHCLKALVISTIFYTEKH